ncbi:MAG: TolC family protein [Flammeovirgaceae bacterium]|nr:TolC family protein [Flammeovirgaceae bacterium]
MSLQECIDYTLANNLQVKNKELEYHSSKAKVGEFLSLGYPQISGNVDFAYNYIIPTTFIQDFVSPAVYGVLFTENVIPSKPLPPAEFFPVQFGTKYTGRMTLDFTQMVFDGSFFVGLKASQTYTELSRKDLIKSKTDAVTAIKKAYYSVMVNKERLALVEKNLGRLDSLLRDTKSMYENGFVEKIDVNRIQVQFNNIKVALQNAAFGLKVSMDLLKFQMGMSIEEKLDVSDDLNTLKFQVLADDFKEGFEYEDRIEYSVLMTNHDLVGIDIKNTKVQYMPKIDLYGNYGGSYGTSGFNNLFAFGENWFELGTLGVRMSIPIFDGMQKSYMIKQKKFKLEQVENSMELLKNQIDMEKEQASSTFNTSLENLRAQQENMALAEEVYRVTKIKYEQGVGANIEVIDADASYKEAQTNYYSALYDALIATVDMEKAYGKLGITE